MWLYLKVCYDCSLCVSLAQSPTYVGRYLFVRRAMAFKGPSILSWNWGFSARKGCQPLGVNSFKMANSSKCFHCCRLKGWASVFLFVFETMLVSNSYFLWQKNVQIFISKKGDHAGERLTRPNHPDLLLLVR